MLLPKLKDGQVNCRYLAGKFLKNEAIVRAAYSTNLSFELGCPQLFNEILKPNVICTMHIKNKIVVWKYIK